MGPIRIALMGVVLAVTATVSQAAALADRHVQKSLTCEVCHGQQAPAAGAEVASSTCQQCHPKTAIVQKFEGLGPKNPHQNHLGDIDCSVCHLGHAQSKLYCLECHPNFELKMK